MALTAKKVERGLKTPGRYSDEHGLYLQVTNANNRSWIFRFERDGKEYTMGLGPAHTVSLSLAREKAKAARLQLLDNINPLLARRSAKAQAAAAAVKAQTFGECAEAYFKGQLTAWSTKHASQWSQSVLGRTASSRPCEPAFDHCRTLRVLLVSDIDTGTVLKIIEPMWSVTPETASRVRARIEAVLAWATVRGYRSGQNPAQWKNHLDKILPKKGKVTKVKAHEAMPYQQVPAFVAALAHHPGVAAKALAFAIFTAARSGEVRGATWGEIDSASATWTVPGERMKAGVEHKVPLTQPVVDLLATLRRGNDNDLVFGGAKPGKPIHDATLLLTMRRMGQTATPHGFRASFRTWAAERTAFLEIVAELALALDPGTAVVKAYKRTTLIDQRRKLMEMWGTYCMSPPAAETGDNVVVSIRQ